MKTVYRVTVVALLLGIFAMLVKGPSIRHLFKGSKCKSMKIELNKDVADLVICY